MLVCQRGIEGKWENSFRKRGYHVWMRRFLLFPLFLLGSRVSGSPSLMSGDSFTTASAQWHLKVGLCTLELIKYSYCPLVLIRQSAPWLILDQYEVTRFSLDSAELHFPARRKTDGNHPVIYFVVHSSEAHVAPLSKLQLNLQPLYPGGDVVTRETWKWSRQDESHGDGV